MDSSSDNSDDEESLAMKYSDFYVTINTHKPFSYELEERLRRCVREEFHNNEAAAAEIFGEEEESILFSEVKESATEVGPQRGFLHIHFVWEIRHSTRLGIGPSHFDDGRGLNQRLQEYFSEALDIEGCYVHCTLLRDRSKSKNYARKTAQNRASERTLLADRDLF